MEYSFPKDIDPVTRFFWVGRQGIGFTQRRSYFVVVRKRFMFDNTREFGCFKVVSTRLFNLDKRRVCNGDILLKSELVLCDDG